MPPWRPKAPDPADPELASALELVTKRVLKRRGEGMARLSLTAGLIYHPASAVLVHVLAPPAITSWWLYEHAAVWLLCITGLVAARKGFSIIVLVSWMMIADHAAAAVSVAQGAGLDPGWLPLATKTLDTLTIFYIILSPARSSRGTLALAAAFGASIMYASHAQPNAMIYGSLDFILVLAALFAQRILITQARTASAVDFADTLATAPRQIALLSARDGRPVEELFKPNTRLCVCVSSDWREYQRLSGELEASYLAGALTDYYHEASVLMQRHFPNGNYFSDWIADELFLVAYSEPGTPATELANAALRFAGDLLAMKTRFHAKYGFPAAIDIGLSLGDSMTGILGPRANRKCTALGQVPGRSRRLQTAGKLLRARLGDRDRAVLDRAVLLKLTEPFAVEEFPLASGDTLRDLDDRSIFFLTGGGAVPQPEPVELTAGPAISA